MRRDAVPAARGPIAAHVAASGDSPHSPGWLPFALAFVAAAYLWPQLDGGWYPHDEGQLGQAAERVLAGELPHRDFSESYTGGLAFLHAAAFRLFGTTLVSLRYALFAAYVAWIPCLFAVARRTVPVIPAAVLTLLGALWSVPLYPAAIPSWFNLFLVTAATAALLHWGAARRRRWLLLAGVACGVSLLAKVTGLFHLAGALLACLLLLQADRAARAGTDRPRAIGWCVIATLLVVAAMVLQLTARSALPAHLWLLGLPTALACVAGAWREWHCAPLAPGEHWRRLAGVVAPVLAGAAAPVALFLVPFARAHALGDLWRGVFVLPASRMQFAAVAPDAPWLVVGAAIPVALFLLWRRARAGRVEVGLGLATFMALLVLAVAARQSEATYRVSWSALWVTGPAALVVGALALMRARGDEVPAAAGALPVLLPMVAFASLIQFPFMSPIYYAYILPLGFVLLAALTARARPATGPLPMALAAGLAAFVLLSVRGTTVSTLGYLYERADYEFLGLPRAGLRVPPADRVTYEMIMEAIASHAHAPAIWAGPDAPEVYFLAAKANPGRAVYGFFDSPAEQAEAPLQAISVRGVDLVVVRQHPPFSDPLPAVVHDRLARLLPDSLVAGDFTVRWAR